MEVDPLYIFQAGGAAMYAILALGLIAWAVAAIGVILIVATENPWPPIVGGVLALLLGLTIVVTGIGGYFYGMSQVESALEMASPENRKALRAKGEELAKYPLYFGAGTGAVPILTGVFVLALGVRRKMKQG